MRLLLILFALSLPAQKGISLASLYDRIWTLKSPNAPPGAIYIFKANGTLLQTSCVETYRIALWSIDKKAPRTLRITEDGQLAFTADILELTPRKLRLARTLVRSREKDELILEPIERESVCPEIRK